MVNGWGEGTDSVITTASGQNVTVENFVSSEGYTANAARLFAVDSSGNTTALHFYYEDSDNYNGWTLNGTDAWLRRDDGSWTGMDWTPADISVLDGDLNSYSFYIELANLELGATDADPDTWIVLGHSYQSSYADLLDQGFVSTGFVTPQPQVPWAPNFVVPEPSSGLLWILGGAWLALRRRRKNGVGKSKRIEGGRR